MFIVVKLFPMNEMQLESVQSSYNSSWLLVSDLAPVTFMLFSIPMHFSALLVLSRSNFCLCPLSLHALSSSILGVVCCTCDIYIGVRRGAEEAGAPQYIYIFAQHSRTRREQTLYADPCFRSQIAP